MFKGLSSLPRQRIEKLCEETVCYLKQLQTELMRYFPANNCCAYIINPFPVNPFLLPAGEQEDIIYI